MSVSEFWRRILEQSELAGDDNFVEIILEDSEDFDSYDLIFKLIYSGTVSVKKEERDKIMGKLTETNN
jgi:hypothetical protein